MTDIEQGCMGWGISRGGKKCKLPLTEGLLPCYADALGLSSAGNEDSQTTGQGST